MVHLYGFFYRVPAAAPSIFILSVVIIRYTYFLPGCALLLLLSVMWSLSTGSIVIAPTEVFEALFETESRNSRIIMQLRLPRVISGFLAGGMLALAGCLLQVLLRNPLADPYILGISGGASVASLIAIMAGLGAVTIMGAAAAGAIVATALVFVLAYGSGIWSSTRLLLTGVILASGWGAIISFLLAVSTNQQVFGMLFWLMGDVSQSTPGIWTGILLLTIFIGSLIKARDINLLSGGELRAGSLGVSVKSLRILLFFAAATLTAGAVTLAGTIGFVGLVVPHIVRLLSGNDHRGLIPGVTLLGGTLVVIADTVARTIIAPQQLPVGVITAFIGVPLFLILLRRTLSTYQH
jgi:iron complex transport system permease protein